jgi:ketosteroid isomerase-like protein
MHHPSGLSYTDYDPWQQHWQPDYEAWRRQWQRTGTAKPERERRERKPTLASVAKQAIKAGIEVARYEVEPDGKIVVVTGKPSPAKHSSWDDLETGTRQ